MSENELQAKEDTRNGFMVMFGCAGAAVILLGLFIGGGWLLDLMFSEKRDSDGGPLTAEKQEAVQRCKSAVKENLKSPNTAKFREERYLESAQNDNNIRIELTVDAQNSFGAELRNDFSCDLTWNVSSKSWTLDKIRQQ